MASSMNIFGRVTRIVKSYTNSLLNSAEDPEKMLEQTVIEMQEDLVKMRQATAQVMASKKQMEAKYTAAKTQADDWYKRAQLAVSKGDDELAKEALTRHKNFAEQASSLENQVTQQTEAVEKLLSNTRTLEQKVTEAKSKKDTLKARVQAAKTAELTQGLVSSTAASSNALAAFERMEEKVLEAEARADAVGQLTSGDDVAKKFAALEGASDVDLELAKLKGEVKPAGELPEGRPVKDAIDQELEELRKKAKSGE